MQQDMPSKAVGEAKVGSRFAGFILWNIIKGQQKKIQFQCTK